MKRLRIDENILLSVAEFLVVLFFTGLFALIANITRDFGFFGSPIVFVMAICFFMTSLLVSYSRKGNWVLKNLEKALKALNKDN